MESFIYSLYISMKSFDRIVSSNRVTGLLDRNAAKFCSAHEARHRYRAVQFCYRRDAVGRAHPETTGDLLPVDQSIHGEKLYLLRS